MTSTTTQHLHLPAHGRGYRPECEPRVITSHTYATREDVKTSLDVAETARTDAQVDRELLAATDTVNTLCRRTFTPLNTTRYFTWPDVDSSSWRLDLEEHEIVSVDTLTGGGTTIGADEYYLEPVNNPPYDLIELRRDTAASWGAGATPQRSIAVTGTWCGTVPNWRDTTTLAASALASATSLTVTSGAGIGVGDLLLLGDERVLVTGRSWLDSGQDITAGVADHMAVITVPVADGTQFEAGESIKIGPETMWIVDVVGNDLTVKRAWDGSQLSEHLSGASVYASRRLAVDRAAGGTQPSSHADEATVQRLVPPGLIRDLCLAEAITGLLQSQAGYARSIRTGEDTVRETLGRGLVDLRKATFAAYHRAGRTWAV